MLRRLTAPFRNYLNNHFEMVKQEVRQQQVAPELTQQLAAISGRTDREGEETRQLLRSFAESGAETQMFVSRQLAEVRQNSQLGVEVGERVLLGIESLDQARADFHQLRDELATLRHLVDEQRRRELARLADEFENPVPERFQDVTPRDALMLNRMNAHDGYLSQAGLWVNEPLSSGYENGVLGLHDVNERIVEIPFVMASSGLLARGSRVLDVGCCESVVALSLASLGHQVTALDPRPYPFAHPMLEVVTTPVELHEPQTPYDAVVLLSTIEHIGVGWYGLEADERLDLRAMQHVHRLLVPGGLLVLTTPFGKAGINAVERTYDVAGIRELTAGFEIQGQPVVAVRQSRTEWTPDPRGFADVIDDRQRVVMLVARRIDG